MLRFGTFSIRSRPSGRGPCSNFGERCARAGRWFPPSFVEIGAVGAEKTRKEVRQKRGGCSESPPLFTNAMVANGSYSSSPNGAERRKINRKERRKAQEDWEQNSQPEEERKEHEWRIKQNRKIPRMRQKRE